MKEVPEGWQEIGFIMSNFDHTIDPGASEILMESDCVGEYAGWNFCGLVWYEDNLFHCAVNRYGSHVDTISADSLEEIMENVSDEYGYE